MHLIATLTFTSALVLKSNWDYRGRNVLAPRWHEFRWSGVRWCSEATRREATRGGTLGTGACQSQRGQNDGSRGLGGLCVWGGLNILLRTAPKSSGTSGLSVGKGSKPLDKPLDKAPDPAMNIILHYQLDLYSGALPEVYLLALSKTTGTY